MVTRIIVSRAVSLREESLYCLRWLHSFALFRQDCKIYSFFFGGIIRDTSKTLEVVALSSYGAVDCRFAAVPAYSNYHHILTAHLKVRGSSGSSGVRRNDFRRPVTASIGIPDGATPKHRRGKQQVSALGIMRTLIMVVHVFVVQPLHSEC